MRKIKVTVQYRVPSWNFCNHDGPTPDQRFSKELCRFCVSTKEGKYCTLYDKWLASDRTFTHKVDDCIQATAGFAITADEQSISVDPKLIVRETLKSYNKTLNDLLKQGYPRPVAESLASKYLTGGN